ESARVPMIIKVPGKKPAICHSFTELIDLYPTVAELAGLEYSSHLQGKSLVKTLDNPEYEVRHHAFSVTQGGKSFLIRTSKWAYSQYDEDAGAGQELYDMEYDSRQYNNLAHNPKYAGIVKEMQKRLDQKLAEVRDNDLGIDYSSE